MKKFFFSLLASFVISYAAQSASKAEVVDIESIRYTMPTVAADLIDYVIPTKESFQDAP